MARAMPRMNMMPPMVGVPCLFLCHLGPTSRMVWPNFSLCSSGMSHRPSRAVTAKDSTATERYNTVCIAKVPSSFQFFSQISLYPVATVSALELSAKVRGITVPICTSSPAWMDCMVTVALEELDPAALTCRPLMVAR